MSFNVLRRNTEKRLGVLVQGEEVDESGGDGGNDVDAGDASEGDTIFLNPESAKI